MGSNPKPVKTKFYNFDDLLINGEHKKPQILFLDEASSHLDKTNEHIINKNLQKMHITQVIIAHRQETIDMADRIIRIFYNYHVRV